MPIKRCSLENKTIQFVESRWKDNNEVKDEMVIMKVMKSKNVTILSAVCSCSSINSGKKLAKQRQSKNQNPYIYITLYGWWNYC